jgi:hypothetical protein
MVRIDSTGLAGFDERAKIGARSRAADSGREQGAATPGHAYPQAYFPWRDRGEPTDVGIYDTARFDDAQSWISPERRRTAVTNRQGAAIFCGSSTLYNVPRE